jgi:pimeloyl-ACP methyl ester carboxylesterase
MSKSGFHSTLSVPASGGNMHVGVAGAPLGTAPVVLAVHGITGSHISFLPIVRRLGDAVSVLAPDLRGRGQSNGLGGPHGMAAHVEDLRAVLTHAGVERATLAGHSMGAYVVSRMAAAHPGVAQAVVLIDGGLPLNVPAGVDPDALVEAVLGPAIARLSMEFASVEAYRDFWRRHPAFSPPGAWTPDVLAYVDYDLTGEAPHLRSRVQETAVRFDGRDLLDTGAAWEALKGLACPVVVVRAPLGLLNEPNPLIPAQVVAEATAVVAGLVDVLVPDTNHYLIAMGDREAALVAEQILAVATA